MCAWGCVTANPILFLSNKHPGTKSGTGSIPCGSQLPMTTVTDSTTFMEVSSWKALLGVQTLNLCFNPATNKFCLQIDNTRKYIRIDGDLVVGGKLDKSADIAVRIDNDPCDLDGICVVKVKASQLQVVDSM